MITGIKGFTPRRSSTGVCGIGMAMVAIKGRRQLHVVANCGQRSFKFNTVRLGRLGALRLALVKRTEYEHSRKGAA